MRSDSRGHGSGYFRNLPTVGSANISLRTMNQRISCPICQLDSIGLTMPDEQRSVDYSHCLAGLVAFTCCLSHVFFLRSNDAKVRDSARHTAGQGCSSAQPCLDDDLALLSDNLGKLKAAKSVNIEEIIEQFKTAVESAQSVRGWVLSEMPEASWRNREELDACFKEIQKRADAKALGQLRTRLLTLATELERGSIVHRRAVRVSRLNQLRDQAIKELRSQARSDGVPQTLPGPQADQWIEWACGLNEPEHTVFLRTLGNGFPHLDDLVAHLEPGMWRSAGSPISETSPEPERPAHKTPDERSRVETSDSQPTPVSSEPIPIQSKTASEGPDNRQAPRSFIEQSVSVLGANKKAGKFCIYRKSEKAVALDPKTIDHEMFAHFGEQPDGMGYYFHWDEVIASRIAKGEELDMIRAYFVKRLDQYATAATQKEKECLRNYQTLIKITDWLDQNFTLKPVTASDRTLCNTCTPPSRTLKHLAEIVPIRTRQNATERPHVTA